MVTPKDGDHILRFLGADGETWHTLRVGSRQYCYELVGQLIVEDREQWGATLFSVEKLWP